MKQKLLFQFMCTVLSIQICAQESVTYAPVFGDSVTIFFTTIGCAVDEEDNCSEISGIYFVKDIESELTYKPVYRWSYDKMVVSEDNSKLWGHHSNNNVYLLMDLDMQIGDNFTIPISNENCTVTNIYQINGRKIIEFDKLIYLCYAGWQEIEIPFMFIESVGMNFLDGLVFAKYEDRIQKYQFAQIDTEYYYGCIWYYRFVNGTSGIGDTKNKNLTVVPSFSNSSILVQLPEQINYD